MSEYPLQRKKDYTLKLRGVLSEMPKFAGLYFRAMELQTSILTRYGYAIDLRSFFKFCTEQLEGFNGKTPASLTLQDQAQVVTPEGDVLTVNGTAYTDCVLTAEALQ